MWSRQSRSDNTNHAGGLPFVERVEEASSKGTEPHDGEVLAGDGFSQNNLGALWRGKSGPYPGSCSHLAEARLLGAKILKIETRHSHHASAGAGDDFLLAWYA